MLFITLQGSAPTAAGWGERDLLQSEARFKGSQTKAAWVRVAQTCVWSGVTLHQCVCAEGKGQEVTGDSRVGIF